MIQLGAIITDKRSSNNIIENLINKISHVDCNTDSFRLSIVAVDRIGIASFAYISRKPNYNLISSRSRVEVVVEEVKSHQHHRHSIQLRLPYEFLAMHTGNTFQWYVLRTTCTSSMLRLRGTVLSS